MKTFESLLLVLVTTTFANSQPVRLIKRDSDLSYEEYSVLKSDKKIKHGSCLKLDKIFLSLEYVGQYNLGLKDGLWSIYYHRSNNLKQKGYFKNGLMDSLWISYYPEGTNRQLLIFEGDKSSSMEVKDANPMKYSAGRYKAGDKIGVWEFFDPNGELTHMFNYDSGKLVFIRTSDQENYNAGFIGGDFAMYEELYRDFNFDDLLNSIHSKKDLKNGSLVFQFTVSKTGEIVDILNLENTIGNKKIFERAMKTVSLQSKKWYPRKVRGVYESASKKISFLLEAESQTSFFQRADPIAPYRNNNMRQISYDFKIQITVSDL